MEIHVRTDWDRVIRGISFRDSMSAPPALAADRQCIRQHRQPPFVAYPQKMNEGAVSWSATKPCDVSF